MNIDSFLYGLYRVVSEPVLALFSSITLIFGGYYLRKPPLQGDVFGYLYPLIEKVANVSIVIGSVILVLFVFIKIAQNR